MEERKIWRFVSTLHFVLLISFAVIPVTSEFDIATTACKPNLNLWVVGIPVETAMGKAINAQNDRESAYVKAIYS